MLVYRKWCWLAYGGYIQGEDGVFRRLEPGWYQLNEGEDGVEFTTA